MVTIVREFKQEDLQRVMELWLNVNIKAHPFIAREYWISNFNMVKSILPEAEIYIYQDQNDIQGFVGLDDGNIAGIFVSSNMQSKGIGKSLIEKCKTMSPTLSLNVYEKNKRAVGFYLREGFIVDKKQINKNTGEMEYFMVWENGS